MFHQRKAHRNHNSQRIQLFQLTLSDQSFKLKDIFKAAVTSFTSYPNISFIQVARHRRSSLNRPGIPDFDEFIHKKIHITLRSCLIVLYFDPTTLIEIAVYHYHKIQ